MPNPKPRPAPEIKTQEQVSFLLSKKSPMRTSGKQQLKADLRHGNVIVKKSL